jgi:hypothetical protein
MIKQNRETTIVLKCCLLSCPGVSSAALEDHRYRYKPKFNIFFLEPIKPNTILAAIDREILKLQQARALLVTNVIKEPAVKKRGRPKSPISKKSVPAVPRIVKGTMSNEGKARIAAAQKKRWAAVKRASKRAKSAAVASKQIAKPAAKPAKAKKATRATKAPIVKKVQSEAVAASE